MTCGNLLWCLLDDGLDCWKDAVLEDVHLFVVEDLKVLGILQEPSHPVVEEVHQGLRVHFVEVVGADHGVSILPLSREK